MALLHTASMIDRACASQLSEFDLSEGRLGVLLAAARDGQATPAMLAERLGVTMGETRRDGRVTLEPVYCLGLCAIGPIALVDGRPTARLDYAKIDAIAAEILA